MTGSTAEDLFERMSEGYRIIHPASFRKYNSNEIETVRLRQFTANTFVGYRRYLPATLQELRQSPEAEQPRSLDEIMRNARSFILLLNNPNRISLMVPEAKCWREYGSIFAATPRQWQLLEQRYNLANGRTPTAFVGWSL